MKARFATYLSAGVLALSTICVTQPAFADDGGVPSAPTTTDDIPHVQTSHPVPIPHFWQPDGPWATQPRHVHTVRGPSLDDDFCASRSRDLLAVCLDLKQLLHLLTFRN